MPHRSRTMTSSPTTSEPKLSDVAKHLVVPSGITKTGYPAVEAQCRKMGVEHDPWQKGLARAILAKRENGMYAAGIGGVLISICRQVGKALPTDTPILTPSGFRTMGELGIGDQVYAPNGEAVTVTVKSPVMRDHMVYRLTFTDGRSIDADAEHLWTVRDARRDKWVTLTTQEMIDAGLDRGAKTRRATLGGREYSTREYRWQLPRQRAVQLPERDLPIDPYMFGAWLGDGVGVAGRMVCAAEDVEHWVAVIAACGFIPNVRETRTCHEIGITCAAGTGRQSRSFGGKLRKLGVLGDKHIPDEYLTASPRQREALLQGLMDTDGTISPQGTAEFTSMNRNLADGVLFLARSLGWKVAIHEGRAKIDGRDCGPKWRVTWTPDTEDGFSPFRMPRKASRVKESTRTGTRTVSVASIERVDSVPVQCIGVDSEDHLYLAGRQLIPTHNTFTIGTIIFALCNLFPGMKVLWTAHHSATSDDTFEALSALARRRRIAPSIRQVRAGNGKQRIVFTNGSRIMFGAREHGFGRGIPGISIVVLDECQILKAKALSDMIPAANTAKNPLIIYMGTPPKPEDPAEVFRARRKSALEVERRRAAGEQVDYDTLYVEVGADQDDDPDDRATLARANPSFPHRTPWEAILRLRENLTDPADWSREGLGIWDEESDGEGPLSKSWPMLALAPEMVPVDGVRSYGVAFSADGMRVSLGGCIAQDDRAHVELIDAHQGPVEERLASLADWFAEEVAGGPRWRRASAIVISGRAGAGVLEQLLLARKIPKRRIVVASSTIYYQACGMLLEQAATAAREASRGESPSLTHLAVAEQAYLDDAAGKAMQEKRTRDGAWGWTVQGGDETPIEAVSLALYGARVHSGQKSSDERKAVVL